MLMAQKRLPRRNSFLRVLFQHLFPGSIPSPPALWEEVAKLLSSSGH